MSTLEIWRSAPLNNSQQIYDGFIGEEQQILDFSECILKNLFFFPSEDGLFDEFDETLHNTVWYAQHGPAAF